VESLRRRELARWLLDPPNLQQAEPSIVEEDEEAIRLIRVCKGGLGPVEIRLDRRTTDGRRLGLCSINREIDGRATAPTPASRDNTPALCSQRLDARVLHSEHEVQNLRLAMG